MEIHQYISTYGHYRHITRSFQYKILKNVLQLNIKLHACGYQKYNCFLWKAEEKKQVISFVTVVIKKVFEIKSRFTLQVACVCMCVCVCVCECELCHL